MARSDPEAAVSLAIRQHCRIGLVVETVSATVWLVAPVHFRRNWLTKPATAMNDSRVFASSTQYQPNTTRKSGAGIGF
jgi:hypothetical protein